ncbi:uncharacterized protein haspin [Stegastes partitus]|uniref:Serine/threonine-protein kinase haspin n=1 Tax=Stegastes partitus TaxID=144197 RepID=A0A3B5AL87_9TELE|nr:PREDICTED: serine/threonine-protein kinase haspin [Stegastes partitus]
MKPSKPLILKTYGKQRRKVSAWISPDDRKQAFDSTLSTDDSVFEDRKSKRTREKRTKAGGPRAVRLAKKKAMQCLTEKSSNEEIIIADSPPPPPLAQQNKATRERRKTSVASKRVVRPARGKAKLAESSSDEENISRPSPPAPQLTQQSKTTRKSRLVSKPGVLARQAGQWVFSTSKSEEEVSAPKRCKTSVQMKTDTNVHPPPTGRFVTHRRRAAATKPKLSTAIASILSSSDDFTCGAFGFDRIHRPSRRRKVPSTIGASSVENSMNAAGTSSFAANPLREISLNELADHSLGPCPRKPIFCSTPSAGSLSKRGHPKVFPFNDQSSTSQSMSVSFIGVFEEDSPEKPVPHSASLTGLNYKEKLQPSRDELQKQADLHHHIEPSVDLFVDPRRRSCSDEAKSNHEDSGPEKDGELPSVNLLSTDSGRSSHFVSAAAGLEWLIEALKEKCLTERCTVQLERLDFLTVTQLCSQTTYSSCLEHSSSVHSQRTDEQPQSMDGGQTVDSSQSLEAALHLSVANNKTSDYIQSVNSFEQTSSMIDSHSCNISSLVDCKQSADHSSIQSESVLYVESGSHTDSSCEIVTGTQLPASSALQTQKQKALAAKDECLTKKPVVQIKKLSSSQLTVQQLKGFAQHKDARLACNEKCVHLNAYKSEDDHTHNMDDPEDNKHSEEITERLMVSKQLNNSPLAKRQSAEGEMEEKAAVLKGKCLADKLTVEIKRFTLSQVKENLQFKDVTLKSSTDVSDSTSDDQTKTDLLSESDSNHCNEDTASVKVSVKNRGSICLEDKITSDREPGKNSGNVVRNRKKMSLAPKEKKRRSTSTDRPGTTRKACVSGMSVSRWKNKGGDSTHVFRGRTAQTGRTKAVDCSINELIPTQHKQPRELLGATTNFSTPLKANQLNLSSLLADFTPSTHTWSRLKAALSVHRKAMVLLTPRSLHLSASSSPVRTELADVSRDLFATPLRTPLSRRLQSQLQSQTSLVVCEDAELSDAEKVYSECGQQQPLPWEECILPHRMKRCVKIGEGTFGEVFSTTNASGDTVALKIIPVEGSEKVNGEDQKTFGEILHEIIISKELSSLKEKQHNQTHAFIGLNDLHCVQGCYPPDFMNAWDAFDQRKGSENDRPDFFKKDQFFIILEFEFGGADLENSNGTFASLRVAKSILHQVTAGLAVAEQELHFEHRDLHWGNVLVKTTKEKTGSFLLNGTAHCVETKGVLVRIIDYSLSRLEIDDLTVSCDISNDEDLFLGQGDYQFEVYRLMRKENGNNWSNYHPHTNVLWLHYLCSKLLSMKYRGTGGRSAKDMREELTRFYDNVLQYSSATEVLQNCPMFQ